MVLEFKSLFVLFVSNGNKEKKTCWSFYHSQVFLVSKLSSTEWRMLYLFAVCTHQFNLIDFSLTRNWNKLVFISIPYLKSIPYLSFIGNCFLFTFERSSLCERERPNSWIWFLWNRWVGVLRTHNRGCRTCLGLLRRPCVRTSARPGRCSSWGRIAWGDRNTICGSSSGAELAVDIVQSWNEVKTKLLSIRMSNVSEGKLEKRRWINIFGIPAKLQVICDELSTFITKSFHNYWGYVSSKRFFY
jgi:hypothetical protein